MTKQPAKLWPLTSLSDTLARIATIDELRRLMKMIAGYLFVGVLPERRADDIFDRLVRSRRAKLDAGLGPSLVTERMNALLCGHFSDPEIRACVERNYERQLEDMWGRWQASHGSNWQVRTEVIGLQHVTDAISRGSGVVFWGMSFCGTLFAKIALSRDGVDLTQLSSADHGADYPLTWLGKRIVGPLHCLPENRYICDRIRIPVDGGSSYLRQIAEVLRSKGCIWIAGERNRANKFVAAELLGHTGHFPVGAPTLALRHNAALLPVHAERLGRLHYQVTIEAPIPLERKMSRAEVIDEAVQNYADILARQILKCPADWDWDYSWVGSLLKERSGS